MNLKHPILRAGVKRRILVALGIAASFGGARAEAATLTVQPGESIQAAVARAAPGDRIDVSPGTYHETVFIDKDRIELHGIVRDGQWPVLDGESKLNDGILASGHGVVIDRMWVKRYKGNGIMT